MGAYSTAGATGDDVNWTLGTTIGANSRLSLVCGWWKATTLTAGRFLWSVGNTGWGVAVGSTTDELELYSDNATTDGVWFTTGWDQVTDEWRFGAFWINCSTGSTNWRVWRGTANEHPTQVTVTNSVAPSGSYSGSNAFTLGNRGTGTVGYQGVVGDVTVQVSSAAGITEQFGVATTGTTTTAEEEHLLHRLIYPIWRGERMMNTFVPQTNNSCCIYRADLLVGDLARGRVTASATSRETLMTYNGAGTSAERTPRQPAPTPHAPWRRR